MGDQGLDASGLKWELVTKLQSAKLQLAVDAMDEALVLSGGEFQNALDTVYHHLGDGDAEVNGASDEVTEDGVHEENPETNGTANTENGVSEKPVIDPAPAVEPEPVTVTEPAETTAEVTRNT